MSDAAPSDRAAASERTATILEHLVELRGRLFKASIGLVVGFSIALIFYQQLFDLVARPYLQVFPEGNLQAIRAAEPFSVAMRVSGFTGFVLASPVIFYQVWAFVAPGLTKRERRWTLPIVAALVVLFTTGVVFAYSILPRALEVLGGFLDVTYQPAIGEYVSFALRFLLVFGLTFEFPVFLFAGAAAGFVSSKALRSGRRWAVLIIVIVSAAATPTGDAFTLFVLAGPLYALYEVTILLIRFLLRK
ncbi:MAG: twin-arginine translocase subunit TatC [Acidimicrobiia bacterium]|jgi:sec-independent protein translocase protein TatC|nr:MAG: twin-arginine translocase subunit TatC [Acidimicrobiia bacterium]